MDKKKILLGALAAAALIEVILIIVGIVMILQLHQTRELLQNGTVIQQGAVIDTGSQEAPSILADSDVDFGGKDTVSLEKGLIDLKVSATPVEFRNDTEAKAKIGGKSYKLRQKDNSFFGSFPVSVFEEIDTAVLVLKDGERTRSEQLIDYQMDPFCPSRITWEFADGGPQFGQNKTRINEIVNVYDFYGTEMEFSSAQIWGQTGDKAVYKADMTMSRDDAVDAGQAFRWEDEFDTPKEDMTFYAVSEDEYGFTYRYKLGTLAKGGTAIEPVSEKDTVLEITSPKGKILLKRSMEDIQEVEDEV